MSVQSDLQSRFYTLLSYLIDIVDTGPIEICRYHAQSHSNTSHRNDALRDGECLQYISVHGLCYEWFLVHRSFATTYRSNRRDHIVVPEKRSPRPTNKQARRIDDQTKRHRERRCDRHQSTAVSLVDYSAWPHIVGAEYHGSHGCSVTKMASIEGTRISARGTADFVEIYISAHSASDLRLV